MFTAEGKRKQIRALPVFMTYFTKLFACCIIYIQIKVMLFAFQQ